MSYIATWHQGTPPSTRMGAPLFHRSPLITFSFWGLTNSVRLINGLHPLDKRLEERALKSEPGWLEK